MKDVFSRIEYMAEISKGAPQSKRWRAEGARFLKSSAAYASRDTGQLYLLALGLRAANDAQINVARDFPDVFHANVINSRVAENQAYNAVLSDLDTLAA